LYLIYFYWKITLLNHPLLPDSATKQTVMAASNDDILTDILPLKYIVISDMI